MIKCEDCQLTYKWKRNGLWASLQEMDIFKRKKNNHCEHQVMWSCEMSLLVKGCSANS